MSDEATTPLARAIEALKVAMREQKTAEAESKIASQARDNADIRSFDAHTKVEKLWREVMKAISADVSSIEEDAQ